MKYFGLVVAVLLVISTSESRGVAQSPSPSSSPRESQPTSSTPGVTAATLGPIVATSNSAAYVSAEALGRPVVFIGSDASPYGIVGTFSNHPLGFRTNNLARLFIDTGGNVGVGTTTPGYRLDVSGDANITGTYRVNGVPISSTTNWTQAGDNIYYMTGNVGVGTTAPGKALHISTSTNSGHLAIGGANQNAMIFGTAVNSVTNGFLVGRSFFSDDANTFFIYDLTANSNRLLIDALGNVGIGTTTPASARLQVNGASGNGVYGISTTNRGVWGESSTWQGVYGKSITNAGVVGEATLFHGVFGISHSGNNAGVYGTNDANGSGVAGVSAAVSLTAAGVYGKNDPGIGVIGESNSSHGVFGVSTGVAGVGVYARNLAGGRAFYAEGDAGQVRDKGGLVKAMIYVNFDGSIQRCYNGVTNVSTGNCGFTINVPNDGVYRINFGFGVSDRFLSVTAHYGPGNSAANNMGANFKFIDATTVDVFTFDANGGEDTLHNPFMIIVF